MSKSKIYFFVSDQQFPFADKKAIKVVEKAAAIVQPDVIVSLGDLIDFPQLSKKFKPSRPEQVHELRAQVRAAADHIHRLVAAGKPEMVHIFDGNHEQRLERLILADWPGLWEMQQEFMGTEAMLRLPELPCPYTYTPYPEGKMLERVLYAHHGTKHSRIPGQAVRKEIEALGVSVIQGHTHSLQRIQERKMHGNGDRNLIGIENGCLCDFVTPPRQGGVPRHTLFPNWHLGFTVVEFTGKGKQFQANTYPIINNRAVVYGKEVKA